MDYEYKKAFLINAAFTAIIGVIVYFVSKFMLAYLLPFLIAIVLSYILHRPADYLGRKTRISSAVWRCLLLITVYTLFVGAIVLLFWISFRYLGDLIEQAKNYIGSEDNLFYKIGDKFTSMLSELPDEIKAPLNNLVADLPERAASLAADIIPSAVAAATRFLPAFLISSIVTVVASFYIAKDYKRLVKFLKNILGEKRFLKICEIKKIMTDSVCSMAGGYMIMAAITFILAWIGLTVIGVKYSGILALLIALVDLLPVLGAGTVLLPWAIFAAFTDNMSRCMALLVLYGVITVVRNFAEPKIIGKKLDINPLLMLITVFVGLRIGGIAGMLILPVTVIVIISYYKKEIEKERGN